MQMHSYNTRSKKKQQPNITLVEKKGQRGPPPKDPPTEDIEDVTTVYLDDFFKGMDQKKDMSAANSMITLLTIMANSELSSRNRLKDIKKKRKEQEERKSPRKDLEDELNELNKENSFFDKLGHEELEELEEAEQEEDEGVSFESLIKKHEKKRQEDKKQDGTKPNDFIFTSQSNRSLMSLLNSDSDDEYDELDEEYCEMWENETANIEDEEWDYFHDLKKQEKKQYLDSFKELNKLMDNTPIRFKIIDSKLPIDIKSIAMKKTMSISQMDPSSGEYFKAQQWIETLMTVPFGVHTPFPVNAESSKIEIQEFIHNLSKTMTSAIYGHKEAKAQILQIVGQSIKNPQAGGNVIAIQGPMGNGKTTLVKEGIAKALGRPFAFIALGGAGDASFFDGHNYTYEGSKWGRIVDILIHCKSMNPIFYFDELDKISDTSKGQEIVHLLTHLTDSSQNSAFNDNYFSGIDFDLSKALFIFSFNDESMVDPILKDRMNVINTDGFDPKDKMKIANEYLLPNIYDAFKIVPKDILFPEGTITDIITNYTNSEKGVRNLKRCLENIVSKLNVWTMLSEEDQKDLPYKLDNVDFPYTVTTDTCSTLLNKKKSDTPFAMYL